MQIKDQHAVLDEYDLSLRMITVTVKGNYRQ